MGDHLRICIVAFSFSPEIGGAQTRAKKQAQRLQELGHDVTVVTIRHQRQWPRAETLDCLTVVRVGGIYRRRGEIRVGRLGIWPVTIRMFFTLWHLRHHYDVIHVMQFSPLAGAAALIARVTHKPVVITVQSPGYGETTSVQQQQRVTVGADPPTADSYLEIEPVYLMKGDLADLRHDHVGGGAIVSYLRTSDACYQVLSSQSQRHLIAHGFPAARIVHISGSVDTEKFRPAPQRQANPAQSERTIICVARLDYAKGIDVLLHAWGQLMHCPAEWRAHLNPKLLLVGDGPERIQLEHIVARLGIEQSVQILGWRADIVDLLQQSWGFVLPSRCEGMPNALLEAMACGLPCIATRVSGSEDIISDGVNGLLVASEQPAEMAEALRLLVADSDLAQRLGREGRATVIREYQLTRIVDECVELYRRLLSADAGVDGEATPSARPVLLQGRSEE
ncbi:MAG: glycosyltransferase family 4 protein [Ktedonobacterales bacterium]